MCFFLFFLAYGRFEKQKSFFCYDFFATSYLMLFESVGQKSNKKNDFFFSGSNPVPRRKTPFLLFRTY